MSGAEIVIVEDEALVAMDLRSKLQRLGYRVPAVVGSGREAVSSVAEIGPDLVLMDIKLKGEMDGVETAQLIHSRFEVPVVYLTAYGDEATLERAGVAEPFRHLIKPVDESALRAAIDVALNRRRLEQRSLRERERWLAAVLRSTGHAVATTDGSGRVTFMNPVAEELSEWRYDDAAGSPLASILTIAEEGKLDSLWSPVLRALGEETVVHLRSNAVLIARSGRAVPIDGTVAPITDEGSKNTGAVFTFYDVTERRQLEQQLLHAQKMESVGLSNTAGRPRESTSGPVSSYR